MTVPSWVFVVVIVVVVVFQIEVCRKSGERIPQGYVKNTRRPGSLETKYEEMSGGSRCFHSTVGVQLSSCCI